MCVTIRFTKKKKLPLRGNQNYTLLFNIRGVFVLRAGPCTGPFAHLRKILKKCTALLQDHFGMQVVVPQLNLSSVCEIGRLNANHLTAAQARPFLWSYSRIFKGL